MRRTSVRPAQPPCPRRLYRVDEEWCSIEQTYKYLPDGNNVKEASIITGRGCPFHCAYCGSFQLYKGIVRFRSPKNIYDELLYLKKEFDISLCNFIDDTFPLNKRRVEKICNTIKPLGIKWFCLSRVDTVDQVLFEKMKWAGCVSVTFGFESGSNKILKRIKKGTTVEQSYEAIKITHSTGLKIRGQMMVGLPDETDDDIEATAIFIRNAKEVDTFGLHVFQPFPGCDIWNNPESYNWKIEDNFNFSEDSFHTIGKPNEILTKDKVIWDRYLYLKSIIGSRTIEEMK